MGYLMSDRILSAAGLAALLFLLGGCGLDVDPPDPGDGNPTPLGCDDVGSHVCDGNVTVSSFVDLDLAEGCNCIKGNLSITGTEFIQGSLGYLVHVVGNVTIAGGANLVSFEMPTLVDVGGDIQVQSSALLAFGPPALRAVGGNLEITNSSALASVYATLLEEVGGDLTLQNNTGMAYLSLPALTDLGGSLSIQNNQSLPACAAEAVRDQLQDRGYSGQVTLSGNTGSGSC